MKTFNWRKKTPCISDEIKRETIKHLFGSVGNFERTKKKRFFHELHTAFDFMRVHGINEDNFEDFAKRYLKRIPESYIEFNIVHDGIYIPYAHHVWRCSGRSREQIRTERDVSTEEKIYRGMYSVVYGARCDYRYQIVNGIDLDIVERVSQEAFETWLKDYTSHNASDSVAMEYVREYKCPKLRPKSWRL